MSRDLTQLFQPKTIAVIGGGAWCEEIVKQCLIMGFSGEIWRVHPKGGAGVFTSVNDLPAPPDACFIGVNRNATIEVVRSLAKIGAGGAICFASGFSEASREDGGADELQQQLLEAAGSMPILGPNCYGFINALDGALLWPDQHGATRVDRGVAILTQSSNIAINLTMQARGLPIAYMITCGNMAQTSQAEIANALLDDARVSAIALHVEGFGDLREWEALSAKAAAKNIPLLVLKIGRSAQAKNATISHTASLAGDDAGAQAFIERLGMARVSSLPGMIEALKILHVTGPLASTKVASISCSGGEASLAADMAHGRNISFPELNCRQTRDLSDALGPMVALANPLDYHTYIWRDQAAMTKAWAAIVDPEIAMTLIILDVPRSDRCDPSDWDVAIDAAIEVRRATLGNIAVVATLPELLPEEISARLIEAGVVPLHGLGEAFEAIEASLRRAAPATQPVLLPGAERAGRVLTEAEAKRKLAEYGLEVPRSARGADVVALSEEVGFPLVLKGEGIAHKTEAGAVVVGLTDTILVSNAAKNMPCEQFLVEEMVVDSIAEMLIGITRDEAHGFALTIAAGGVLTELLTDSVTLLVPASEEDIKQALTHLKIAKILEGYRGKEGANCAALVDAIIAVQAYVIDNNDRVEEIEVNPLMCTASRAIAVDALIKEVPR